MRRTTVTLILSIIAAAFVFLLVTRGRDALPDATATPAVSDSKDSKAAGDGAASPTSAKAPAAEKAGESKTKAVALGRPLRVVSHGWDLVVPGLVAREKGEFERRGLTLEVRSVARLADIEAALAAGGDDDKGADIAILALPLLALTYEDLRALEPAMFWVVGYSRGRDALYVNSTDGSDKRNLRAPARGKIKLVGERERASTFVSLFALDLAGADVGAITLISPDDARRASAPFAAVDRSLASSDRLTSGRRQLLSSAEATTLVPYVAIAPRGFLDRNADVATAFGAAWLRGVEALRRDVPAAARSIAALEGTPEPVVMIKRLGQIEFVGLGGNARLLGLSGRGAVSAHALFRHSFRIWRESGIINTAAPETAPIAEGPVSTLVFGKGATTRPAPRAGSTDGATPLLLTAPIKADEDRAIERIGLIAGLFSRSVIEVGFDGRAKATAAAIRRASERFGIDPARLVAAPKRSKRRHLTLAVLPIP